ncbi:hypothetical protein DWA23_20405, partial [Acinetobacter baumannii]
RDLAQPGVVVPGKGDQWPPNSVDVAVICLDNPQRLVHHDCPGRAKSILSLPRDKRDAQILHQTKLQP